MKMLSNAHTHTTFCDGIGTVEEIVQAALRLGFTSLGFSEHGPVPQFADFPGMLEPAAYRNAVMAAKEKYAGQIEIACGVEQDFANPMRREDYDYIIGSVHYVPDKDGCLWPVDDSPQKLKNLIETVFDGDALAMAKTFFAQTAESAARCKPDIVGHFDLLVKYNRGNLFFDEEGAVYRSLALEAADAVADAILPYGGIIEVNTGGMARGWRDTPYPSRELLRHFARRGVRVMLNSDSHAPETLDYAFDMAFALIKEAGFKTIAVLQDGEFADVAIR